MSLKGAIMKAVFLVISWFCVLHCSNGILSSSIKIGVNYGKMGTNLPSPYLSIEYLKSMKAGSVKLYDTDPEILKLLSGSDLHVAIMVKNDNISKIAENQTLADQWVLDNVVAYHPGTLIRYILVGNEVFSQDDKKLWLDLAPAMWRIKKSLKSHAINNIKVGTPMAMDALEMTFPPSTGRFRSDIPSDNMLHVLKFLNGTKSYFFLNAYPYFPWFVNPGNMSLDFALFKAGVNDTYKDPISELNYTNMLDQMLDSVNFAMRKYGFDSIKLAISETGWPNAGDIDQPGANIYNAATYNRNLVKKMTTTPPLGTPAKPGVEIPTFIFSLYDENQKPGPRTERHWGLLQPSGMPVYEIDLSGQRAEDEYPELPVPLNNEPYRGKVWCVVASLANIMELEPELDFACRQGNGTCDALAPGKECYEPVSLISHASYAFSSYWARFRETGADCYFNGLAVQTTRDPSRGSCKFPSVSL